MARQDLRKQITIFPPDGKPGQKHSLLNARDLITHQGWSTTPQHQDQFTPVADVMSQANIEPTEEELRIQFLKETPIDTMKLPELHEYAEVIFGAKIDKRLNQSKVLDRLEEIAAASNIKLLYSEPEKLDDADKQGDEQEDVKDAEDDEQKSEDEDAKDDESNEE